MRALIKSSVKVLNFKKHNKFSMKTFKPKILLLILLAIFILLLLPKMLYKDPCKEDEELAEQIKSSPECKDTSFRCINGVYIEYYYDKRIGDPAYFPINGTIARYTRSYCYCEKPIIYEIFSNSSFIETSCKEFHNFIHSYNSSCSGCVGMTIGGCC